MTTFYIDFEFGNDLRTGLTPDTAKKSLSNLGVKPGDSVLFKRGLTYRGFLTTTEGTATQPVTYGAYGEGPKPKFSGSMELNQKEAWHQVSPQVWKYSVEIPSEVGNLIFNEGKGWGHLRWEKTELEKQGDWHFTGLGLSEGKELLPAKLFEAHHLYLFSKRHPIEFYTNIEAVLWGERKLTNGKNNIIFENLEFCHSSVHGYQDSQVKKVILRHCDFKFIGGGVWNRERRIRFGNAIEFWDGAEDILVENCLFENIYDSGVTHQGGRTVNIPKRLVFKNNVFKHCGMAAYECREPSEEVCFEHNICLHAGGDFSMQADLGPRQSEIYPEPMGHHVFIWRIQPGEQKSAIVIRHNVFDEAPVGMAIYSDLLAEPERHLVIEDNTYYQSTGKYLVRFNKKNYLPSEFLNYQQECQKDKNSHVFTTPRQ